MKTRKLIDSFIFYNELSTLNMRLHELDDYVDYFVIVEAGLTHSGNENQCITMTTKRYSNDSRARSFV